MEMSLLRRVGYRSCTISLTFDSTEHLTNLFQLNMPEARLPKQWLGRRAANWAADHTLTSKTKRMARVNGKVTRLYALETFSYGLMPCWNGPPTKEARLVSDDGFVMSQQSKLCVVPE